MNNTKIRLALIFIAAALLTVTGTSCNTIHGMGRDVERTGENIQNATR